ncbi:unnamed protein product [Macrosiphum euphorbiae]|uniref:Uncharacterized protein n=1 Tax=Macrosiphum euphorbiae TaxID=13131 RepID=A0AAV0VQ24_9HEMI|nr:unnamed protein product [Macrosiphum euphorbiae]
MIFHLIILTTTSLFSQVKCRTYVPEKYFVDHNLNRRQTNNPGYNPTEQRQIVFVDKGQYPNGWNENIMKGYYRSPIIFSDKGPVTINYRGIHSGPKQPPDGYKNSCPIVISSQGKVTVNYDDSQDDVAPPSNQDICQLTNTMVELPSGIVLPYMKFKTISPYLLAEDQKSDILVILGNKNMTYKQFQETLRHYGCGDLEDSPRPSEIGSTDYVTLANGTLKAEMDDYRNIVSSLTSGSETLMVPNVVSGKYSVYRSLIADELPELRDSAFVITHEGIVVPFSLYYAVDREHFQRPPTAAVVPCKVQQIKWGDGKLVDVQTVRHVIDALRTPTMISFVFPNGKRMPFVRCSLKEPTDSYDFDPEKVMVDVGQCKNVLLSHFNDILKAVHIPDDDCKNKRFNNPVVFALDPKCLNTTDIYNVTGPVNPQTNNNCTNILKAYTECNCKQILKTNETKSMINIKNTPTDDSKNPPCSNESTKNQTVTGCNENLTTNDNKNQTTDTVITTIVTQNNTELVNTTSNPSICGKMDNITTIESKNNATENPDCTEIYIKNEQNSSSPITEGNKMPIVKSNNDQTETKNTMVSPPNLTSKNTTNSNTTTTINPNQATMTSTHQNSSNPVSGYKEEPTMNDNNQYQTETKNTTTIPNFVNNTSSSNITNPNKKYEPNSTSNSSVTTETRNNTTNDQNNYQNSSNPVIEGKTIPITTAGNNNQTETKDTTIISAPNITENTTGPNNTNTDKIYAHNETSNNAVTTEIRNNNTTDPTLTAVVPDNRQNDSNPVNRTNEIPAVTNGNHYQNSTETINTTASTPDSTENTKVGSNEGRKDNDTYTGSNETPSVNNTAETIQTSGATRASDGADDVGPMENGEKIPETNTTGIDDETPDIAYNSTMTGKKETNQPTPIYTETIKSPNNNSVTNNATKIINIVVY